MSIKLGVLHVDLMAMVLDDDELTKIVLSVHMLLYLVAFVLDPDTLKGTQTNTRLASTTLLKRRMVKNGWCEKRLNFLDASPMVYPAFYFLSSFKPPRINAEDHSSCSSERCLVTSKLSETLHRTNECLCGDVVVPVDRVNAIVAAGGIPLVRTTQSPLGKTELEVVPYTPSTIFIAVSHVWADQQFGSTQNSVPKCQVEYLEEVLSSFPIRMDHGMLREWVTNWQSSRPGEITPSSRTYEYFWLDSFCSSCRIRRPPKQSHRINEPHLRCSISHLRLRYGPTGLRRWSTPGFPCVWWTSHLLQPSRRKLAGCCGIYICFKLDGQSMDFTRGDPIGTNCFPTPRVIRIPQVVTAARQ